MKQVWDKMRQSLLAAPSWNLRYFRDHLKDAANEQ